MAQKTPTPAEEQEDVLDIVNVIISINNIHKYTFYLFVTGSWKASP